MFTYYNNCINICPGYQGYVTLISVFIIFLIFSFVYLIINKNRQVYDIVTSEYSSHLITTEPTDGFS
jgi:hypothetical protein